MAGERQKPGHRGLVNPEEMMMASPKWLCVTADRGTTGGRGWARADVPSTEGTWPQTGEGGSYSVTRGKEVGSLQDIRVCQGHVCDLMKHEL